MRNTAANEKQLSIRFTILGVVFLVIPTLILLRILIIRANPSEVAKFTDQSRYYSQEIRSIFPARGQIFDRWNRPLASNQTIYEVGIERGEVVDPEQVALVSSICFGADYAPLLAELKNPEIKTGHININSYVTQEQWDQCETKLALGNKDPKKGKQVSGLKDMDGLHALERLGRFYPEKSLASNLLGFVNRDGKGVFGVEAYYNSQMAGKPMKVPMPLNPINMEPLPGIFDGIDLVMTIDIAIQKMAEEMVDKAIKETGSESATIVIYDPTTGEVLGMATTPRMDLNQYQELGNIFTKDVPFNRGISGTYEPGSVYKVLTMAAALDAGAVKPDTVFVDQGYIEIGGTPIYNWNRGGWGPQTMLGCMQHSLNVCLAWTATQLGTKSFYNYMRAYGIGHLTGIDMANEVAGRLKWPGDADWYEADLGTNSFGQGVSVTPIQMVAAIGAVANHGRIMQPHVGRTLINKNFTHNIDTRVLGTPLKPETATTLTEMLAQSLEIESSDALITGYRVAGKTGTAEIAIPGLGYTSNQTNASFVGWGPADDPKFLVYVWLEKPTSSPWGSVVASPVFAEVVEKLVVLMKIPPDDVRHQLSGQAVANSQPTGQ